MDFPLLGHGCGTEQAPPEPPQPAADFCKGQVNLAWADLDIKTKQISLVVKVPWHGVTPCRLHFQSHIHTQTHIHKTTSVVVLNTFKFHYISFLGRLFIFLVDCHESTLLIPLYMYYYYYQGGHGRVNKGLRHS